MVNHIGRPNPYIREEVLEKKGQEKKIKRGRHNGEEERVEGRKACKMIRSPESSYMVQATESSNMVREVKALYHL